MANIFFITGACGSGKSSIINFLKKSLPKFIVYDFDDVGVPDKPTIFWRQKTTKHWLSIGRENLDKNISTIICGLTIPSEIEKLMSDELKGRIYILLLDVSIEEREKRLKLRQANQELINDLEELINLPKLVFESSLNGKYIINTTNLSIQETGTQVQKLIYKSNENILISKK